MRNAATHASSTSANFIEHEDLPGQHLLSIRSLIASSPDESYPETASSIADDVNFFMNNFRAEEAVLFFTDIVFRFGVPNSIITDNSTQFPGKKFLAFCDSFHIRVDWSAVAHPQTNGQVERTA